MKKLLYCLTLFVVLLSCDKENTECDSECFNALVRWGGEPGADGLGWYIQKLDSVGQRTYIPTNLPEQYKVDSLPVSTCVQLTDEKFYCMCVQPMNKYKVTSITRR
jgi:hypothetical protein